MALDSYAADLRIEEAFAVEMEGDTILLPCAATPLLEAFGQPRSLSFTFSAYGCLNEMALIK